LVNYALITILTVLRGGTAAAYRGVVRELRPRPGARRSTDVDTLDMLLMIGLAFLLLRQIMPIAAGLAGGVGLNGFSAVSRGFGVTARQPYNSIKTGLAHKRQSFERQQMADSIAVAVVDGLMGQASRADRGEASPSWQDGPQP
jgi:hypothetical protein